MRKFATLIMATGTTLILVAALMATQDTEEPVTETVVPKSSITRTQFPGGSDESALGGADVAAGDRMHPGAVARLPAFDADGQRLGEIVKVIVGPDGRIADLHLEAGGFLGLGSRVVAIPRSMFAVDVDRVRISLSSDVIERLPEVKNDTR